MLPSTCSHSSARSADPRPAPGSVAYVVSTWPRLSQTFVLNEVLALEKKGLPVRIFSVKDPGGEPVHASVSQVRASVTYLSLKGRRRPVWVANLDLAWRQPRCYFRGLLEAARYRSFGVLRHFLQAAYLAALLRREPAVHLHAHFATAPALVAMFASQLSGTPYTFTAHARDIYVDTRPELLRKQMHHASAVVTVSEYNRRHLLQQLNPATPGKVVCIYNGIDPSQFPFRWPRAGDPGPPVILSVARLVEKKGLEDLIDAAAILRAQGLSFRVEIIGAGPLWSALQVRIVRHGLEGIVTLMGAQPQEIVRQAYDRAALFVLPCVITADGDRDGIPTVLLEAMLSGVPVVSTPVSGVPELIESDSSGVLVTPNNARILAHTLAKLIGDPCLRDRLARSARTRVESEFSIERSSSQLLALFSGGGDR